MMVERREPLQSGRDTEIDMIEREMEGGVVVIQPQEVDEHSAVHEQSEDERLGGLVGIERHVDVRELDITTSAVSRASDRRRHEP
jgi:hypothetical protein